MARTDGMKAHGGDLGRLLLRLTVGVLLLFHGIAKVSHGISGITAGIARMGLPEWIGYGVYIGEVVAPVLLIVGAWTRLAGLVVVINMIVAVLVAHTGMLLSIGKSGGYALELQAFYLFGGLVVALLGAGRYSLAGVHGQWN